MSKLFDIIRIPFGWFIQKMFSWTGSYVIAVLIFAVAVKLLLFPFSIKQQKNSQKQAKLRPKENIIRKKYAGREDRATKMKLNTEIQELYQKENFNMMGGCLPTFLQMLVLLAVYAVIRCPISYISKVPDIEYGSTAEEVKQAVSIMVFEDKMNGTGKYDRFEIRDFANLSGDISKMDSKQKEEFTEKFYETIKKGTYNLYSEINCVEFIRIYNDDFVKYAESKSDGLVTKEIASEIAKEGTLPKLELFEGFNLGKEPSLGSITDKEAPFGEKFLLILPLLTLISAYFGQAITKKFTYQSEISQDQQSSMKMMNLFMPLFSLFISFKIPAAVSIYWLVQNVLGPVQQICLSKLYPIPEITEEEMKEAERLYGGKQPKKKKNNASNGKKKKSLVYDDDDEYENVSSVESLKEFKEKDSDGDSIVDKAPLKK